MQSFLYSRVISFQIKIDFAIFQLDLLKLLFPIFIALSPIPQIHIPPIPQTIENGRQNTKNVFKSISDDYNAISAHDKANLITYLCTQCGLASGSQFLC